MEESRSSSEDLGRPPYFKDSSEEGDDYRENNYQRKGGERKDGGSRPPMDKGGQRKNQRKVFYRRKVCRLCRGKDCAGAIKRIDYKDVDTLQRFVTEKGKIIPRRMSGTCAKGQRRLTKAIKQARSIAMLQFTSHDM